MLASLVSNSRPQVRSNLGRWPDHLCAVCRRYHHLLHLLLLLPVQDVPPTTSGCHHHHIHHCGACPLSSASKCAAQLPWTKLPGLPHHATSARDASSTLPNAVPTTLPGPTHGPAGLPRDPGWRSSRALPCQPASLQPGLRGCPEGGPLSVLRPLWLPLGYVVCEWCAGTVPYVPAVLCVSCLYMWLPLMLTRWGMILARVGWDQTLFSSSPEIMLPKISSQTQRMGWWGHPVRSPLRGGGVLQGTSGVLLQLTLG